MEQTELTQSYRGFTICGAATPIDNYVFRYFADDPDFARWLGIFIAELAVDHCVPRPWYYLRLRRAAVECMEREIRLAKLYEALDFLEREFGDNRNGLFAGIGTHSKATGATGVSRRSFRRSYVLPLAAFSRRVWRYW
jgi:hypothetical protein